MKLKLTLSGKLIFFLVLIGIVPLVLISIITYIQVGRYVENTVISNLTSLADEVMNIVEMTVKNTYLDIELLATNPVIRAKGATIEEKTLAMQDMQDYYGVFEDITMVDLNGKVTTSTSYLYRGEWISKEYYQEAIQGKTTVSPVHIILNPFKVVLVSATPVKDEGGKITGILTAQLNMEKVWLITDRVEIGESGFAFLINKTGDIISYPEKDRILSKLEYPEVLQQASSKNVGMIRYIDEEKGEMIAGFSTLLDKKLAVKGWKLIVVQSRNEALSLLFTYRIQAIALFFGLLLFVILINFLLNKNVIVPIKKLTNITKDINYGRLDVKARVKTGDEIEELATSFNNMTQSLKASREQLRGAKRGLEEEVKERTKELQEAKSILEVKVRARTKELRELANSLEIQVKDRTKELQERVNELERFQKVTVGRELKMMELKRELKKTKKQEIKKKGKK